MGRKKKSGRKNSSLEKIVLATAVIQLITAVVDLIDKLTG